MRDASIGLIALGSVALIMAALLFGAPVITGDGLAWDNTISLARIQAKERTELERLDNERLAGERWADVQRWLIVAGVVVTVTWTGGRMYRHRVEARKTVQLAALPYLVQRPGAYLEMVEGEWCVVDDTRREITPVARRLTG